MVVLAAGAYIVGYLMVGDNLPSNTVIEGVQVGGLSRDAAVQKLEHDLSAKVNPQMTLSVGDVTVTQQAKEWGLTPDYAGSVDRANPQRSFDPMRIWYSLTGGGSFELTAQANDQALTAAVSAFAEKADTSSVNATIAYKGSRILVTDGTQGVRVNQSATKSALVSAYLQSDDIDAPATVSDPDVTTDEVDACEKDFATPAISGPVTVTVSGRTLTVSPAQIGAAMSFTTENSLPVGKIDYTALLKALQPQVAKLQLTQERDASFTFQNGKPVVVPSQDGVELTADALSKAVGPVLTKSGAERKAEATVTGKKATLTTEAANKLGVTTVTGSFTTEFPNDAYRFTNIGLAAKGINGSLVLPGQTWSLNETLGERTSAKGYVAGSYIEGSQLRKTIGGGISQSATTTYNAIFFAGLKDVEHHPHSLYYTRYPAGREATVSWPNLDLKFQNDTKYGVVLQAYITRLSDGRGAITVKVWSTKQYDVKATDPVKSNYSYGTTRYDQSAGCVSQGSTPGFDVSYKRLFYSNGKLVKSQDFSWRYDAGDRVICGPAPKP